MTSRARSAFIRAQRRSGGSASFARLRDIGGRPAVGAAALSLSDAIAARVEAEASRPPSDVGLPVTRWSASLLGEHVRSQGIELSDRSVSRILHDADLQPHRQQMYLTSHDEEFREKRDDVLRVYYERRRPSTSCTSTRRPAFRRSNGATPTSRWYPGSQYGASSSTSRCQDRRLRRLVPRDRPAFPLVLPAQVLVACVAKVRSLTLTLTRGR